LHDNYLAKGFSHILTLPISFHKDEKPGNLGNRISRAANVLYMMTENVIIRLAPQFLSIFVGFVVVFYIKPIMLSILLSGVLVYIFTLIKIAPGTVSQMKKANDAYSNTFGDAYDAIFNVETVKHSGNEKYEMRKFYRKFVSLAGKLWYKVEVAWSGITFYQRVIVVITQLFVFLLSIYFIQNGEMSLGDLIAINGYAMMVFGPFAVLGRQWQTIQNGIVTIERAEKILSHSPEKYIPKDEIKLGQISGDIRFNNVYFHYKKNEGSVLKDISVDIRHGETIALVGESGVGKSTLIDLISGYYFAQKGKVFIDGTDVKKINLNFLRENIAVVPQEVALFNDTIETNIKYGNFKASDKEIKSAAKKAHADIFIDKFPKKYNQIVGERGVKLSVGQKQRIAIARAILRNPKILILDEPTSALDSKTERYITESLEDLMKGRTTFIIAHRLSTVRKADRILVFKEGRIVEEGKHDKLMKIKNGVYRQMYELHIGLS